MILANPEHIRHYTAQGWWGTLTLDAQFRAVAARHPQREAVVDPPNREALTDGAPRRLSYAALADEAARIAAVLHAQGLRADDIVLVQLINRSLPIRGGTELGSFCHQLALGESAQLGVFTLTVEAESVPVGDERALLEKSQGNDEAHLVYTN